MSVRTVDGGGTTERARGRLVLVFVAVLAMVAGLVLPGVTQSAWAGPGSLVSGVAWADTNRNGVRDPGEPVRAGVPVQLLSSPGGAVVMSATTSATGAYSFANAGDGDYVVRADAPGAFIFPAVASGQNDFARTGTPNTGEPERGATAPFTIAGATQVTALDAGLQPIANLVAAKLPEANACDGFAITGTPPFDADDAPGNDSGPGNCIVRTGDTVMQAYSVSLTGLPTGASVPNVVAEFTVSSPDGAQLDLAGPGTNGIPAGCLAAVNGANPPSSRTINPDGSITVICNLGTMSSNVAAVQLAYKFTTDTPIPSHASIAMRALAGGGDAGTSNTVSGPEVEVTGTAQWDLQKVIYPTNGNVAAGPDFTELTIDGVLTPGYYVRYQFNITDMLGGTGGSELDWPVTFTDVMPEFPGARITECRPTNLADNAGRSPWTLTCPAMSEVQGADGWELAISPNSGVGGDTGVGHMVMTVFVPLDEMNRAIDPTWQPGDESPTGTFDFDNRAQGTDHWSINGGELNYGDGHEPGWDGTGNNLAVLAGEAEPPQWDLSKSFRDGPTYSTETVGGEEVDGYIVRYNIQVRDLAGPDNIGPWLDRPVTFKDQLVSHPNAVLLVCSPLATGSPLRETGTPTCETGTQPADGWDMSFVPNQSGFERRYGFFVAAFFIPMDEIEGDICQSNVTLDLRNEVIDSEHWTVLGDPNNPDGLNGAAPGFEPGWDGTTATGNNLDVRSIRPSASQCGTLTGDKQYIATETGGAYGSNPNEFRPSYAGHTLNTLVYLDGSSNRVSVTDLELCDVFDVSTQYIREGGEAWITGSGSVDLADYVIEYAVGPNEVDTQAGPFDTTVNLFPSDTTSLQDAATDCRDFAGPWSTDPTTFGADWRDHVNMMRVRPIEAGLTEVGPFRLNLWSGLKVRGVYNGGPDAGEPIPHRIRLANTGGWPAGDADGWATTLRERRYEGPELLVDKLVSPTQYLPGDTAVWDLNVLANRTFAGMTMLNVRVVDTIPADLHFNPTCTQELLPDGVTMSYDQATRQVTFVGGDVDIVTTGTNQWLFHPTAAGARHLQICTDVDTLAQPGDTYVNTMQASADNSVTAPTDTATIQVVGSGQMGISKSVDKPFVASGEEYSWTLDWGNTSTVLSFQAPDVIDVLPWNGDGADDALSRRDQFSTDYTGLAQLTGELDPPTYIRGGVGGPVPGTWYYTTANPSTVNHDARHASNADPAADGGLWLTADEVTDFGDVTAVRFVSSDPLPVQSRVRAVIPAVSTSNGLDNVYVNRAMIFSATFEEQPLLSNEPYVLMPGFTLGDLVWVDGNGNGRFDDGEQGVPGVTVQVRDADGDLVATEVTDADGRWSVAGIPAGEYTVHVPAAMFAPGGPLAGNVVRTVGSSGADAPNENADNNNTAAPDPAATGLTSTPVTLSYEYNADDELVGGNGPTGDNVAGLGSDLIPDDFTTFTVDLAVMPAPAVDIEKSTNGQDADTPTGPYVTVGGGVRWTYVVTNTGGVDLTNITVTDDLVDAADIDCDATGSNVIAGPLEPEASFTCVATGTATAGQCENTGTVVGTDPTSVEVTDDDPSHYFGATPAVDIEKATNGEDADEPTGPLVAVGGTVAWTYVVTNTGDVPLTNITVTDDLVDASAIDCAGTGSNVVAGPLEPDDTVTCIAAGVAVEGQYANLGSVVATGPETTDVDGNSVPGVEVDDDDPSHYFGVDSAIDIEKATNGQDADEAPGPLVPVGGDVEWTYVVTNTGNVPLTDVTVTDDLVDAADIDCDDTGGNVIAGPLEPEASFTCVATGTATAGQYENTGTVTGTDTMDTEVTDDDPSHYFGAEPAVDIEKATNGEDADAPTGPYVPTGGDVEWTYVVTNTGNVPLTNVTVTDDQVDAGSIDCDATGSNVIAGPLEPEASFTCIATGTATVGQYANLGTVTGVDPLQAEVTDEDASHYFGAEPAIDIEKATNGEDADEAPGVPLTAGDGVEWTYVVTNTGNTPLIDIAVTDDLVDASEISCDGTGSNVFAGPLQPGESFTCAATGIAIEGPYVNIGAVMGQVPGTDLVVTDDDPANYTGTAVPVTPSPSPSPSPSSPPSSPSDDIAATGVAPMAGAVGGALAIIAGLIVIAVVRRRRA
ncbi:SdrD B-like domain-containing protein [Agromyces sp. H3Y2-19a]|uniref:DUF7507 domain-containing protein n=1 Tax=Agromyces chromiiresistens TaxID=3030835 RepID=UPI0023B934C1|nr:SdrD B-like domain-containing protein [Agromyces chromiiresistens]MDF0513857.1 SdrD B-like domain-containing protein [Agromyces chromiiresistens]